MINNVAKNVMQQFNVDRFGETGILDGGTLSVVLSWMQELVYPWRMHEIDCDPKACDLARRLAYGATMRELDEVLVHCGHSPNVLDALIYDRAFDEYQSFFYLDAHDPKGNGPLLEEIAVISKLQMPIICIDDFEVPGESPDLYTLEMIRPLVSSRTDAVYVSSPNFHGVHSGFVFLDRRDVVVPGLRRFPF